MGSRFWNRFSRLAHRRGVLTGAVVMVVAALAAVVAYNVRPANAEYKLEPVGTTAAPPFTSPTGNDQTGVTSPPTAGQTYAGDSVGLYAGQPNQPACDGKRLIQDLQSDPKKLQTWSDIQAIPPEEVPSFVGGLSGVVLRSDTYVTNYGYDDGETSVQSVLEAGTAVFVDKHGAPVVKCSCGNPVRVTPPPADSKPSFVGQPWPEFSSGNVTIIQPITVYIEKIIVIVIGGGEAFQRQIGIGDPGAVEVVLPYLPEETVMSGAQGLPTTAGGSAHATASGTSGASASTPKSASSKPSSSTPSSSKATTTPPVSRTTAPPMTTGGARTTGPGGPRSASPQGPGPQPSNQGPQPSNQGPQPPNQGPNPPNQGPNPPGGPQAPEPGGS